MKCLSNEKVTVSHLKLTTGMFLMFFFGIVVGISGIVKDKPAKIEKEIKWKPVTFDVPDSFDWRKVKKITFHVPE